MPRSSSNQPVSRETDKRVIGLMQVRTSASSSVEMTVDSETSNLTVSDTLGAVADSPAVIVESTMKEHESGYPMELDGELLEQAIIRLECQAQELDSTKIKGFIDDILTGINSGTINYYSVEGVAEYVQTAAVSLWMPSCILHPTLNINPGNDWNGLPLTFEAIKRTGAYTNNNRLYLDDASLTGAKTRDRQPATQSLNDLAIGIAQVRVGALTPRNSGTAEIGSAVYQSSGGLDDMTSSGTYTGALDGNYEITIDAEDTPDTFSVTGPDGSGVSSGVAITGSPQVIENGVSVTFAATTGHALNDVYTVPVKTGDATTGSQTGIASAYSTLTTSDSIGAVIDTNIQGNATLKFMESGYPINRDLILVEKVEVFVSCVAQEISSTYTTPLFDAMIATVNGGDIYYAPVEIVLEMFDGTLMSFWYPNCSIRPDVNFSPGTDWAGMPLNFRAQKQTGLSVIPNRIYRL